MTTFNQGQHIKTCPVIFKSFKSLKLLYLWAKMTTKLFLGSWEFKTRDSPTWPYVFTLFVTFSITNRHSFPLTHPLDPNPSIPLQQTDNQYARVFPPVLGPLMTWPDIEWKSGKSNFLRVVAMVVVMVEGGVAERKGEHWQGDRERWKELIPVNTQAARWHLPSCRIAEDRFVIPLIGCDYIVTGREWSQSLAGVNLGACSTIN